MQRLLKFPSYHKCISFSYWSEGQTQTHVGVYTLHTIYAKRVCNDIRCCQMVRMWYALTHYLLYYSIIFINHNVNMILKDSQWIQYYQYFVKVFIWNKKIYFEGLVLHSEHYWCHTCRCLLFCFGGNHSRENPPGAWRAINTIKEKHIQNIQNITFCFVPGIILIPDRN